MEEGDEDEDEEEDEEEGEEEEKGQKRKKFSYSLGSGGNRDDYKVSDSVEYTYVKLLHLLTPLYTGTIHIFRRKKRNH